MVGEIAIRTGKSTISQEVSINFIFQDSLKGDKGSLFKCLPQDLEQKIEKKINRMNFIADRGEILTIENSSNEEFFLVGAGKKAEFGSAVFRDLSADVFRVIAGRGYTKVILSYFPELGGNYFELGNDLALSLYLSNYRFDKFKSEESKKKRKKIEEVVFQVDELPKRHGQEFERGVKEGRRMAEGIYLTRDLVNEPASHLHPSTLVEEAFKIEKKSKGKIKVEILDKDECLRLGMGAFLGVAEGSDKDPKFVILKYGGQTGDKKTAKKIVLIGKSITFDSGGLSLKPSSAMEDMKIDMAGGATVLGVFDILAGLDLQLEIYGILPACENMPSGSAMKPGDIVTALNGKTIEVLNTDAEGRLTLADALSYAENHINPDYIIDLATLTGACRVALGENITALLGNDPALITKFIKSAKEAGEEIWEMPLYKPYLEYIKGEVTDLKNTGGGKGAGTITAALFLGEFVKNSKWIHLDIAGSAYRTEKAKGVISKGATGWGILAILKFLKEHL